MAERLIEEIILEVTLKDRGAIGSLNQLDDGFMTAGSAATSFNKTLLAVGASLLAVAGGIDQIGRASETALNFTKLENQFLTVFNSSERARQEFEFLTRTSEVLGLEIQSLTNNYAQLAASTRGTNLEGEETREIFLGASRAITALNLETEDANGIFRAFTQIISKGKVQAEELRGQIGDRLPGAFNLFAQSLGVTTEELNGMLERGEVTSDALLNFSRVLSQEFADKALGAANSEVGQLNRISNDLTETYRKFGVVVNSFIPFLADTLVPAVTSAMNSLLDTSLDFAEKALPEILTVANGVFSGLGTLLNSFGDVAGAIFSFITQGWSLLFDEITGDSNWVDKITGFLTVAAKAWPQLISNAFLTIAKVISGVLGNVQRFFQDVIFELTSTILGLQNQLPEALGGLSDEDFDNAIDLLNREQAAASRTPNFFEELGDFQQQLIDANKEVIQDVADIAEQDREENKKNFKEIISELREKVANPFAKEVKAQGIQRRQQQEQQAQETRSEFRAASAPIQTAFQVGTAEASAFLQGTSVQLKQLAVQEKIEKNTRNMTKVELVSKSS